MPQEGTAIRTGPATLEDVAALAGVSRATASRVLNPSARTVGAANRKKVEAAAAELGYVVNASAQTIARGRSDSIAFVVNAIPDDYLSPIAAGVFHAADAADLMVTMVSTNESAARARRIISVFRGLRPRLLILAGSRHVDDAAFGPVVDELRAFEADGGRVVVIGQVGLPFDTVSIDNVGVGRAIARAFLDLGYEQFTVFAGPAKAVTPRDRADGILAEFADAGIHLPPDRIITGAFSREGGYVAAGEFLRRRSDTEAILATADAVALGAIARLREAGVKLPGDVAISGVDDLLALRDVTPALTTVRLPWNEVGVIALELGLEPAPTDGPRTRTLSGHVVLRESSPRLVPGG
ncbi:LacI family transcriptional regulator [Rathayibacter sp. ZW T2_19]|uniref:LacI family transcriptional regulator n=1 Tax=Rathayibacter rubneri TaxID=2950106 RepID=A0A9X2DX81_9MICO|nr:LacI family DNA-binding transcriptional regulator [Rathayibacter rubneri]MCM6761253.1 LacI family transcriptional regulator [Rathayibacter rubneri]